MIASPSDPHTDALLQVDQLCTYFPVRRGLLKRIVGHVRAVENVSFSVKQGQTLGLVGESGCGKSTVARTILRLVPATSGRVVYDGQDVFSANRTQLQQLRRQVQIVFQDPASSLNPRMTVGRILAEPILVHGLAKGSQLQERVTGLLERVGLSPDYRNRYPHEFSGGQRQRIGIARALALKPQFIVCDEPVSALDVSIQSQILNLLSDLQDDLGLSYLFIAHNLAVVAHFCDRVAVMYLGRIVEIADRAELYTSPKHPYTQALLSAAPQPKPGQSQQRIVLPGEVPSPLKPPGGCPFHPRCELTRTCAEAGKSGPGGSLPTTEITVGGKSARVMTRCTNETPSLETCNDDVSHQVACWFQTEDS